MEFISAKKSNALQLTELTIRSKSSWNYSKEQIENWRDVLTITEDYIEQNEVFVGLKENIIIGYYSYFIQDEEVAKLDNLFLEPENKGKGFGKIFMDDFIQRVIKSNINKIVLDADPNATNFYLRLGFKIIGKLPTSVPNRFLPIMELNL